MFIFGVRNINIKGYTMINIREPESMYKHFNVCQIMAYRDNTKSKTFKQKLVVIVMERVIACVAVVSFSFSFKPSGASARRHWAKSLYLSDVIKYS